MHRRQRVESFSLAGRRDSCDDARLIELIKKLTITYITFLSLLCLMGSSVAASAPSFVSFRSSSLTTIKRVTCQRSDRGRASIPRGVR